MITMQLIVISNEIINMCITCTSKQMDFISLLFMLFMVFGSVFVWEIFQRGILDDYMHRERFNDKSWTGYPDKYGEHLTGDSLTHTELYIVKNLSNQESKWSWVLLRNGTLSAKSEFFVLEVTQLECNTTEIKIYPIIKGEISRELDMTKISSATGPRAILNTQPYLSLQFIHSSRNCNRSDINIPMTKVTSDAVYSSYVFTFGLIQWHIAFSESLSLLNSTQRNSVGVRIGRILPVQQSYLNNKVSRNSIGLLIHLDDTGEASNVFIVTVFDKNGLQSGIFSVSLKVTQGECLRISTPPGKAQAEELYIDFITFHGLYGYPDGFVIDKGKKYKLEDDTTNNRRITNIKRVITFSNLGLKMTKNHIVKWTYF